MRMAKSPLALLLGITFGLSSTAFAKTEVYRIDAEASKVEWTGRKVIGKSHHGLVSVKSGTVALKKGSPVKANIVIDMTSIKDLDLDDPKWNAKLVNHLKSDDFFGVAKHPQAKLVIEGFKKKKDSSYDLKGKLTIKGHTHPVTLTASESRQGKRRKITTRLTFDRTLFDVRYGSGKFFENLGDKMIADDIEIEATIYLEPKAVKTAQN